MEKSNSGLAHPEKKENEFNPHNLTKNQVNSEIDMLKRIKLRAEIKKLAADDNSFVDENLREIASFESADDKRIQQFYKGLIELYKRAHANPSSPDYFKLNYFYARMGHISLYEMACKLAENQRQYQEVKRFQQFAYSFGSDSGRVGAFNFEDAV